MGQFVLTFIFKMKLNIFLVVFMSLLICLKAEICRDTIDRITKVLESDDSITEQIDVLLPVCSDLTDEEDLERCKRNINSYWSYFVSLDFGFYRNIFYQAETINMMCDMRVKQLGKIMVEEENKVFLTSLAQGELFCDMENAFWDVEECQELWEWLMPRLMDKLAEWFTQDNWTNTFCLDQMHCVLP